MEDENKELSNQIITKENISLYYELMSDKEAEKYSLILDELLESRLTKIMIDTGIAIEQIGCVSKLETKNNDAVDGVIKLHNLTFSTSVFGVKDTLKPIDEYLQEIKNSELYKRFNPNFKYFTEDFKLGNNEIFAKHLEKHFGEKVSNSFKNYFVNELDGDLKTFTPNSDRNIIVIESIFKNDLQNDEHIKNCIDLQVVKNELKNPIAQENRSSIPLDYLVMENLNDVFYEFQLDKNGQVEDYKGEVHTNETEFLKGNLLITPNEHEKFYHAFIKVKYPTQWKGVSEDRFYEMLEVMPPKNHNNVNGVEFFQLAEMQTSNITNTFAQKNGKFYESFQRTNVDFTDLANKIKIQFPNKIEAKEILEFNPDDNTGNVALLIDNNKCANLVATGNLMQELELRDINKTKLNDFLTELSKNEGSFLNSSIQKDGLYFDTELIAPIEDGKVNYKHEQQSEVALAYFLNDAVAEKMQLQSLDCEQSKLINTIHNSIKLDEEVAASEFSKIEYESEVYNLLDNESKEVISDYINLKSDTIISDALNEQQKNKDLNTTNLSL